MIFDIFIKRPRMALVTSILIVILGLIATFIIPVSIYPEITPPSVQVSARFLGADAVSTEESVAQPIEAAVNGIDGMRYMKSTSASDGTYTLNVDFQLGIDPDVAAFNVQNRVASIEARLPQVVRDAGVSVTKQTSEMIMAIAFYSPNQTHDGLFISNYLNINVVDELNRLDGVGDVDVIGARDYSMRIWVNPDALRSYELTTVDAIDAIQSQNKQAALGRIGAAPNAGDQLLQLAVTAQGRLETAEEFGNISLKANPDGSFVRLKDVARIELGSASFDSNALYRQQEATTLGLYLSPGANAVEVVQSIENRLEELSARFPEDFAVYTAFDNAFFAKAMIRKVLETLTIAFSLVTLVVFVFLGRWRPTVIPLIAIPVSILGALFIVYLLGFSANTISMLALVLAIGIVVDDAIIVVENVERIMRAEPELSAAEATHQAVREIVAPVIATTLVLLSVFVPVAFLPGSSGVLFREFAVTISAAVIISSINALTLSPALCAMIMRHQEPGRIMGPIANLIHWLGEKYALIIRRIIHLSAVSVPVVIFFGIFSVWLIDKTPYGFVPPEDRSFVIVLANLPPGASMNRTEEVMREADDVINQDPAVFSTSPIIGLDYLAGGGTASNRGLIFVNLIDFDERKTDELSAFSIIDRLNGALAQMPDGDFLVVNPPTIDGLGAIDGFEYIMETLEGENPAELATTANTLIAAANADPEVGAFFTSFEASTPQVRTYFDRDRAQILGVDIDDAYTAMQATLGGYYVDDFSLYGRNWKVQLEAEPSFRANLEDIKTINVRSKTGEMVEMGAIVDTELLHGPNVMTRYNNYRAVSFNGFATPGAGFGGAMDALERVSDETLPSGYIYEWTGLALEQKEATGQTTLIIGLAFIFAYLFLVALYESWIAPIPVLLSVLPAVLGAMAGIWIFGLSFDLYAQIGIIILIAIAGKNAILMNEYSLERRISGEDLYTSAVSGARLRFRPVMMTSLSFAAGLIPLTLASGPGAGAMVALGVPVFFGMVASFTFGIFLIPSLYTVFQQLREKSGWAPNSGVNG